MRDLLRFLFVYSDGWDSTEQSVIIIADIAVAAGAATGISLSIEEVSEKKPPNSSFQRNAQRRSMDVIVVIMIN